MIIDSTDEIVRSKELAGEFDTEWWVNRTKQFLDAEARLELIPSDTNIGAWEIIVYIGSKLKIFGPIYGESELTKTLREARIWANQQVPAYEGATYF